MSWRFQLTLKFRFLTLSQIDLKEIGKKFPYVFEAGKLFFVGENWKEQWGSVEGSVPVMFVRENFHVTAKTHDDLLGSNWGALCSAIEVFTVAVLP